MAKWNSSKVPLTKFRRKWNNRTVWRRWAKTSIQNVSPVLIAAKSLRIHLSILRTDFLTAKKIGTNCSQQSASPADSRSRQETDGWKPSTTTITHNASTARCVGRTSRDKASLWRPENLFAKVMQEVKKSIKKWSCEYLLLNQKNLWMLHILVIKRSKFTHFLESAYLSIRCHPSSLYWAFMATATCVCNALLFHFYGSLSNLWCV